MAFCACGERVELELKIHEKRLDSRGPQTGTRIECCGKCARRIVAAALRAVDVPSRKKKPPQQTLEGMEPPAPPQSPRKISLGEAWFELFEAARAAKLQDLGDDPARDFERPSPAAINTVTRRWIEFFGGDADRCADVIGLYVVEFLRDPWAAGLSPPFPWGALASERVWRPRFEKIVSELGEDQERH